MKEKGVKGRNEVPKATTSGAGKESARATTSYLIMDIERETLENKVMMYAKSYCPHC